VKTDSIAFAFTYMLGTVGGIVCGLASPWWFSGAGAWMSLGLSFLLGITRHGTMGLFFGMMSGALAADSAEILDGLLWPGHAAEWPITAAGVVALACLLGEAVTPIEEREPCRPMVTGCGLYLVVLALCFGPAVWEVMT
jgi:hypothetical protein